MNKQTKIAALWNQYEACTGKASLKTKAAIVAKIRALEAA